MNDREGIINSAYHLRENLGLTRHEKIEDIVEVVKKAEYHYLEDDFSDDFDGFTEYRGGLDYLVGYNIGRERSDEFKRFTLSHELGHLSMPKHLDILHERTVMTSSLRYHTEDVLEKEANFFAINFLAPPEAIKEKLEKLCVSFSALVELKSHFGVSAESMAIQMMTITNSDCSFVVFNTSREVLYDSRSSFFYKSHQHSSIKGNALFTNELSQIDIENGECIISEGNLKTWYPSLRRDVNVTQYTFNLGYNDRFATILVVE